MALHQGLQFSEAVGFKQEPIVVCFYDLFAISELYKCNGQFIRRKPPYPTHCCEPTLLCCDLVFWCMCNRVNKRPLEIIGQAWVKATQHKIYYTWA